MIKRNMLNRLISTVKQHPPLNQQVPLRYSNRGGAILTAHFVWQIDSPLLLKLAGLLTPGRQTVLTTSLVARPCQR